MRRFWIISAILLTNVIPSLSADILEGITQADRLFQATLFDASAEKYSALLKQASTHEMDVRIRSRLVENLFILERYPEAIEAAREGCSQRALFFKGMSHSRLGQEEAIPALKRYLEADASPKEFENEARLQLGLIFSERGQWGEAAAFLEAVAPQPQNPRLRYQAALNLAKIKVKLDEPLKALEFLKSIENRVPIEDPFRDEMAYLTGACYIQLKDYQKAMSWLEQSRREEALYLLGWARLQNHQMAEAETVFQNLIAHPDFKEQAALALAQCYLNQSQPHKIVKLFADNSLIATPDGKAQALLFLAQAAPTFAEREKLYKELTEGPYQNTGAYASGWFERGLNAFKEDNGQALGFFQEAIRLFEKKDPARAETALFLTHQLRYRQQLFDEAEKGFVELAHKGGPCCPDALLFAARCADEKGEWDRAREYRRSIFEEHSAAPCAGEAYFLFYAYRDYVQGERAAIKHLQAMPARFPDSPYLIIAHYLIGMDEKRDRKNAQGKWIRKKNMNDAIDSLQEVEATFDRLDSAKKIPLEERSFFIHVLYRATLERALANLSIAEEAQGAKRQIFLQYAAEVFAQIREDFSDPAHPLASQMGDDLSLFEESSYWLAQTHIKSGNDREAQKMLGDMLQQATGYYLSRAWYELGLISMRSHSYQKALEQLSEAQKAAGNDLLSADQKIDLWIQQSLCHKELHDLDQAMLLLSEAINDDTISSLRVKAMYLRSDIYALQGRHDLARKQLEATAKKGGEWALKAKERLKHDNP